MSASSSSALASAALPAHHRVTAVLDYHARSALPADRSPPSGKVATRTIRHGGAPQIALARPTLDDRPGPSFDALFTRQVAPQSVDLTAIGGFLLDSVAFSAKQLGPAGWRRRLRIFPSLASAYAAQVHIVSGPRLGLGSMAGVYHYNALDHALEQRRVLLDGDWATITEPLPATGFLVAVSIVASRLAPVSGLRAIRDAHLEVGHAIAAITVAAAIRGWQTRVLDTVADAQQAQLLALDPRLDQQPAALLAVFPATGSASSPRVDIPDDLIDRLATEAALGTTNLRPTADAEARLNAAIAFHGLSPGSLEVEAPIALDRPKIERQLQARTIVHRRRHAHAFDSEVGVGRKLFAHLMRRLTPSESAMPWAMLPWRPRIAMLVMVHHVEGLEPGLYLHTRHPDQLASMQQAATRPGLAWQPVEIEGSPLVRLRDAEMRESAELICCRQVAAGDGAFTVVLLAELEPSLRWYGPWFYPRLFWEAGVLVHLLALEAEGSDLSAAFLSRFHDPLLHLLLGIESPTWQAIYAVGIGQRIDDPRIRTLPPYRR